MKLFQSMLWALLWSVCFTEHLTQQQQLLFHQRRREDASSGWTSAARSGLSFLTLALSPSTGKRRWTDQYPGWLHSHRAGRGPAWLHLAPRNLSHFDRRRKTNRARASDWDGPALLWIPPHASLAADSSSQEGSPAVPWIRGHSSTTHGTWLLWGL